MAFTFEVGIDAVTDFPADADEGFSRAPAFGAGSSTTLTGISPRRTASTPRAETRLRRSLLGSLSRPASSCPAVAAGSATAAGLARSAAAGSGDRGPSPRSAANAKRSGPSVLPLLDDRGFAMLAIMAHLNGPGKPLRSGQAAQPGRNGVNGMPALGSGRRVTCQRARGKRRKAAAMRGLRLLPFTKLGSVNGGLYISAAILRSRQGGFPTVAHVLCRTVDREDICHSTR